MKEPSIVTIPNKTLSEVTSKVTFFDEKITTQVDSMKNVLACQDGAGLAAPQIGFTNSIIVIELADEENPIPFQAFINPEIVEYSKELISIDEGCLSIPYIELPVERAKKIKIRFQDSSGKKRKLTAKDIFARILQHEIDHLNGILFTQKVKEKFIKDNPDFKNLRILFFGSGSFGATILEGLLLLGLRVDIVTEQAKPAGRDQKLKITPVAEMAEKFEKKYLEIEKSSFTSLRASAKQSSGQIDCHGLRPRNDNYSADLIICADFGQKIPENILKFAKISAINIHPSLLPQYRGATPVQTAILEGAKETGVTIIEMSPEIDKGVILAQITTKISANENALTLTNTLATLALKLLYEALPLIAKNALKELKQDEGKATLTKRFQKTDGEIDWNKPIEQIERQIRAFYPWPGTYTFLPDGRRLIVHRSHLTGEVLVLDMVQVEGGKPIKWSDFLRGFHGEKPEWFDKVK